MKEEIINLIKKLFGKNLVSIYLEGSFGTKDFISGYSDCDLLIFVKDLKKLPDISFEPLSKKYGIKICYSVKFYGDLLNRIKNNKKVTRFVGNIILILIKKRKIRLISGKDLSKIIPDARMLLRRDLLRELKENYFHATNTNPKWNIFKRKPQNWANYIINMGNGLLLLKGIFIKKEEIPKMLEKYCKEFKGTGYVRKALKLRKTKKALKLNSNEKKKFRKDLEFFLEKYREYVFRVD